MPRAEKESKVKGLAERLGESQATILAGYRGLTVQEAAELRMALAEADTRFSVVKNSLTRLAVKDAGLEELTDLIDGPTAIAFVRGDPVSGAKRLVEQARRFPVLEIRGGFAEGRVLTADQVRSMAALESREVMLAQLAGLAKSQLTRTAWALQALQSRFVGLMEALKSKLPAEESEGPSDSASATRGVASAEPSGPSDASGDPEASAEGTPSVPESDAEGSSGETEAESEGSSAPAAESEGSSATETEEGGR
ncbi:MAG: 50S ribosomal protein L10 [Actinomycetota bacterium]